MPASIRRWESALVDRVAAGDDSALATIFDQFGALVHGIATRTAGRHAATEITLEVFGILWDHPERFGGDQGSLRVSLASVARRHAREFRLAHRGEPDSRVVHHEGWTEPPLVPVPDLDEAARALFAADRVRRALDQLPAHQCDAVEMVHVEGLSFRDLAVRTGMSEAGATALVRRGLERLALELHEPGPVGRA